MVEEEVVLTLVLNNLVVLVVLVVAMLAVDTLEVAAALEIHQLQLHRKEITVVRIFSHLHT